jgi:hypothetical protein
MKLGAQTAIFGEHHLAFRDNLCIEDDQEREEPERETQAEAATASGPAGWQE